MTRDAIDNPTHCFTAMNTRRKTTWLDTETKAMLQQVPPQKLAPATTETFSLVVLAFDTAGDHTRYVRAFERVLCTSVPDATRQTGRKPPFVVQRGLTLPAAVLAQFELACCDIISVFVADPVVDDAEPRFLAKFYRTLVHADEFEKVSILLVSVPDSPAGLAFVQQFVSNDMPALPYEMVAMRKKARIMMHWAKRIGARCSAAGVTWAGDDAT